MSKDPITTAIQHSVGPALVPPVDLAAHFQPRQLARGEYWLRTGERCRHLAFIQTGSLRLFTESEQGEHTRWAFFEGQFCLSMSSFTQQVAAEESIVALEPTTVLELSYDRWRALYEEHEFLRRFWTFNLEHLAICFEARVNTLLIGNGADRYAYLLRKYPDFVLRLPQKHLAEMLGMAPRHLSRIRKELSDG